MVSSRTKKLLLAGLMSAFVVQTALTYTDEPSGVELTGAELEGARLWQEHGCQACHQVHGFGGFLGPDLTNSAPQLSPSRLRQVLTVGSGQMPALHLDDAEIDALDSFLRALDRTGIGQARVPATGPPPAERFTEVVTDALPAGDSAPRRGFESLSGRPCFACHLPFRAGVAGAPDLSTVTERLDAEEIARTLTDGRPPLMPPPVPAMDESEKADVTAFLRWLNDHRSELRSEVVTDGPQAIDWSQVPWWEYDRGQQ